MIARWFIPAALAVAIALPAARPATAQVRLSDLVQVEVLDGGSAANGTRQAALRVTLADGWKTYWRAPGDAGIPPEVDLTGSRNLGNVAITWPAPHVFDQGGLRSIGYARQMVLPLTITAANPGQPVTLAGELRIGICADICIPADLAFEAPLDAAAPRHPAIAAALAARPLTAAEGGVTSATCSLRPGPDGLRLTAILALPDTGGEEVVVVEPGSGDLWASPADTRRAGKALEVTADIARTDGRAFALDRSALRFTVLGSRRTVDIRGCSAD